MRVLVTGGIGLVGRTTVARLLRHGHEVHILDRVPREEVSAEAWTQVEGAVYHQVDITDFGVLGPYFAGMESVVHLAAYPHPGAAPEAELLRVNCTGAFNIYRAAADAGIKRVVSASSINALGYNYGIKGFPIEYLPMDEEHPTYTTDPYSYSKRVLEETADYFWRREGISGVCLRLPGVFDTASPWASRMKGFGPMRMKAFQELKEMPEEERRQRIARVIEEFETHRAERLQEMPWEEQRKRFGRRRFDPNTPPPPEMMLSFGRSDFWALIHVEDAAQAFEKGLTGEYEGSHPLFVCDEENSVGVPSRELAGYFFPEVSAWKREVEGTASLVSTEKARSLIGFTTENSMRAWMSSEG